MIDDEVKPAYDRLNKTFHGSGALAVGNTATVSGLTAVDTGRPTDEDNEKLSDIITVLTVKFGTACKPEDWLLFDRVAGDLKQDE